MSRLFLIHVTLIASIALLCVSAHARIGESRSALEERLLDGRMAIKYPTEELGERLRQIGDHYRKLRKLFTVNAEEIEDLDLKMALEAVGKDMAMISDDITHRIYHKSSDKSKVSSTDLKKETSSRRKKVYSPDGWDLHVIYYQGKSIFESYHKIGNPLITQERDSLLIFNKGRSTWAARVEPTATENSEAGAASKPTISSNSSAAVRKALLAQAEKSRVTEARNQAVTEAKNATFFGFQYERADGLLRASYGDGRFVIFDATFDRMLADKSQTENFQYIQLIGEKVKDLGPEQYLKE